jgi:hypothetical protein
MVPWAGLDGEEKNANAFGWKRYPRRPDCEQPLLILKSLYAKKGWRKILLKWEWRALNYSLQCFCINSAAVILSVQLPCNDTVGSLCCFQKWENPLNWSWPYSALLWSPKVHCVCSVSFECFPYPHTLCLLVYVLMLFCHLRLGLSQMVFSFQGIPLKYTNFLFGYISHPSHLAWPFHAGMCWSVGLQCLWISEMLGFGIYLDCC